MKPTTAAILLGLLTFSNVVYGDIALSIDVATVTSRPGDSSVTINLLASADAGETLNTFTFRLDNPGPGITLRTGEDFQSDFSWSVGPAANGVSGSEDYFISAGSTSDIGLTSDDQILASLVFDISSTTPLGDYPLRLSFFEGESSVDTLQAADFAFPVAANHNISVVPEPNGFFLLIFTIAVVTGVRFYSLYCRTLETT